MVSTIRVFGAITVQNLVSTVAGNGVAGYGGDGGGAAAALINEPQGATVDAAGNLYIADFRNSRIRKVSPAGTVTTIAGSGLPGFSGDNGAALQAQLSYPSDVEVDAAGNLYIADTNNHRIRRVSAAGVITTVAGNGVAGFGGDNGSAVTAQLYTPTGIAIDGAGNLYIADTYNSRIRKVTPSGIITTVAGSGAHGFSGEGQVATSSALNDPTGIAVDAAGNLYIADRFNHRIRTVTANGLLNTIAGTGTGEFGGDGGLATAASLQNPSDVAVDKYGSLYIADQSNHRVRKVSSGVITTVAGSGVAGFSGDGGNALFAAFNTPLAVAVDTLGSLFVVDTGNQRVRKVTLPGPPVPSAQDSGPMFSAGLTQTLTFKFSHPQGYQQLGVVNVLINESLSGEGACYVAYSQPAQVLFLVNDQGPSNGLSNPVQLGANGTVNNSQCTIFSNGSSAVGTGTTLTLKLNIAFKSGFAGNKIIYTGARDTNELSSGWKTLGVAAIPAVDTSYPRTDGTTPPTVTSASQIITVDFRHATNANSLQTAWVLVNNALNGMAACYAAYYVPGNLLFLFPDNGDASRIVAVPLSGTSMVENSQCRISAQGSSAVVSGNLLSLRLNVTMKSSFTGPKAVWGAVQTLDGQQATSRWKALGAWLVP